MKVSIVIPNYNGEKYLETCLSSLHGQTYKDFELIIVDNASTDSSLSIISKFKGDRLNTLLNTENQGFSKAVNTGIKAAKGKYVVLLNNDTEAVEDWLSNLVKCIELDSSIFSVSSKMIRYYEKDKIDDAGDCFTILGWAYKRGDGESTDRYSEYDEIFSSCAGAAIYRKSIFREIGYFDENFFAYLEDVDIGYRARIYGYKNYYCPDAIVYHIGSATTGSKYNNFKIRISARNNVFLTRKNMPFLQLLFNSPLILLGFIIKGGYFSLKGYGAEYFQGLWEGLVNSHKVQKVKIRMDHLSNYARIEYLLVINLIKYIKQKSKIG